MNIYTKNGDQGNSTLINGKQIPKYDERFHLLGSIDELTSQIGMVKIKSDHRLQANLTHIQKLLMTIMASVADTTNPDYLLDETEVTWLEQQIDQIEQSFPRKKEFILPGETELSTRLDVARTVCRRAERWMAAVDSKYHVDQTSMKFINRLSDYLYIEGRYADYLD